MQTVVTIKKAKGCKIKSLSYFIKEASYEVNTKRKINNKTINSWVSLLLGNLFKVCNPFAIKK